MLLLLLLSQPPPDALTSPTGGEDEDEEAGLLVLSCADEDGALKDAAPSEGLAAEAEPAGWLEAAKVGAVLLGDGWLSGAAASWLPSSWRSSADAVTWSGVDDDGATAAQQASPSAASTERFRAFTPPVASGRPCWRPTCPALAVAVRRLVGGAGALGGVSVEDVTKGGAAGAGRHRRVHAIRG